MGFPDVGLLNSPVFPSLFLNAAKKGPNLAQLTPPDKVGFPSAAGELVGLLEEGSVF
jgi:hypothetical protein